MQTQSTEVDPINGREVGEAVEVADGIFAVNAPFWGFPNVVYFIKSGASWALIDTGVAETPALTIGPFLEKNGGLESLELVMGTHGHVDHIGGNGWVKEHAPNAKFAVGARDVRWAEDVERHYCQLYVHGFPGPWRPDAETEAKIREACGAPVGIDYPLHGGEVLTFGEGRQIEAIHLGAHTPGQTLYRDVQTGLVFSGDAIQNAGIFNDVEQVRDFPMYGNIREYRQSLETIRNSEFTKICTAHAGIFSREDGLAFLDESIGWAETYSETVRQAIQELNDFDIEEIVQHLGTKMPEYALILQIRVTTAEHLSDLVVSGELIPYMRGTEKRWRTN